jgi:hypothetical protein
MTLKQSIAIAALALLTACGPSGGSRSEGPGSDAINDACRALGDTAALFGANADVRGYRGLDDMAESCEFASADGARAGELILYTAQSLGAKNAETRMGEVTEQWDAQTETPLAAVEGLGEAAQIATDLPGYQTQIAFRKGGSLVLIAARSGDDHVTGEALARRMAQAAAGHVQ